MKKYPATLYVLLNEEEDKVINDNNIQSEYSLNSYYERLKVVEKNQSKIENNNNDNSKYFKLVEALEPIWKEFTGEFSYMSIANFPFLSKGLHSHPLCKTNDGYIDALTLGSHVGTSWCDMFNFITFCHDDGEIFKTNDNKSINNIKKGIGYDKTKVYRLLPKKSIKDSDLDALNYSLNGDLKDKKYAFNSFYSIDGEKYDVQPLQVICKNKVASTFGY